MLWSTLSFFFARPNGGGKAQQRFPAACFCFLNSFLRAVFWGPWFVCKASCAASEPPWQVGWPATSFDVQLLVRGFEQTLQINMRSGNELA